MPQRIRNATHSPSAHGVDAANAFFVRRLMRNSFLDELRTGAAGRGIAVHRALVENDAAGAVTVGIGARLANGKWDAGQWTQATTTFTDDTTDAQDAGASDFPLHVAGTNNDGHLIACLEPFSAVLYDIGTAFVDTDGGATEEWSYWDGTQFTAFTPLARTANPMFAATGRNEMLFQPPADWATATSTQITGLATGSWYVIRYRATDAPSGVGAVAASATTIQVWDPLRVAFGQTGGDATADLVPPSSGGLLLCGDGEGLVVAISTANAGNLVSVCGEDVGNAGVLGGEEGATSAVTP